VIMYPARPAVILYKSTPVTIVVEIRNVVYYNVSGKIKMNYIEADAQLRTDIIVWDLYEFP